MQYIDQLSIIILAIGLAYRMCLPTKSSSRPAII